MKISINMAEEEVRELAKIRLETLQSLMIDSSRVAKALTLMADENSISTTNEFLGLVEALSHTVNDYAELFQALVKFQEKA